MDRGISKLETERLEPHSIQHNASISQMALRVVHRLNFLKIPLLVSKE